MALFTKAQMNTKIGAVTRSDKTLRDNVQAIIIHACGHVYRHGDTQYFTKLFAGVVGVNKPLLKTFCENNLAVNYNKKKDNFSVNKAELAAMREAHGCSGDDGKPTDDEATAFVASLELLPDWYVKPDAGGDSGDKEFDLDKSLSAFVKKIVKAQEDDNFLNYNQDIVAIRAKWSVLTNAMSSLGVAGYGDLSVVEDAIMADVPAETMPHRTELVAAE